MLFKFYSEEIIKKSLEETPIRIKINGKFINNIRYADDIVLIAESLYGLQTILNQVVEISGQQGLTLNIKKTKFMSITKLQRWQESSWVRGERAAEVEKCKYFGTVVRPGLTPIYALCQTSRLRSPRP